MRDLVGQLVYSIWWLICPYLLYVCSIYVLLYEELAIGPFLYALQGLSHDLRWKEVFAEPFQATRPNTNDDINILH